MRIPNGAHAYQDKFKALPGDDVNAGTHMNCTPTACTAGNGNGVIDGAWNASSGESYQFWQQVRYANLAAGTTDPTATSTYVPQNAVGGIIGITSATTTRPTEQPLHLHCLFVGHSLENQAT